MKPWMTGAAVLALLAGCAEPQSATGGGAMESAAPAVSKVLDGNGFAYVGPVVTEDRAAFLDHRYWAELTPVGGGEGFTLEGYLQQIRPDSGEGVWTVRTDNLPAGRYRAQGFFCAGPRVAIDGCQGEAVGAVSPTLVGDDATVRVGPEGYLQRPDGTVFLKTGAGSPENILSFAEFDGTRDAGGFELALGDDQLHRFAPHLADWRAGDPVWGENADKGKAIIGLFNYYADVGVTSQYLVGMNLHGDGQDVFPYTTPNDPYVFDLSKLAQWAQVFDHANARGVMIHFLFTETENESYFEVHDGVEIGEDFADSRKLYYREMVARFGHLPLLSWNLGEENGIEGDTGAPPYRLPTTAPQRLRFTDYIAALDARDHPVVMHTWPDREAVTHADMLGHPTFDGMALQGHHSYFDKVVEWKRRGAEAGHPWMVSVDEPQGWEFGAPPDAQAGVPRPEITSVLWPSLLGGATGVEWYFGWQNNAPTSDLSNEDQRTRNALFAASARVRRFFETLPLTQMTSRREGEAMILEGAGRRLVMEGDTIRYTVDGQTRTLDPHDPE